MTDRTAVGGRRAVVEAIRAGRVSQVLVAPGVRETQGLRAVSDAAAAAGVDIVETERAELDRLASDHQGVVARMRDDPERPTQLGERELGSFPFADDALAVVLDGITDPRTSAPQRVRLKRPVPPCSSPGSAARPMSRRPRCERPPERCCTCRMRASPTSPARSNGCRARIHGRRPGR